MKKVLAISLVALLALGMVFASGANEAKVGGGSLVIYSPNSDALLEAADVFGQTYGIDVQVLGMGTGECLERIVNEDGNAQADVMYGGVNFANGNKYQQYFEQYTAKGNDKLPKAYQCQNGCVTKYCLDGSGCLVVNKDVCKSLGVDPAQVLGYEDLLNPKLKGHIAMGNPAASSSAWAELTNMLAVMGDKPYDEKAWEYVEKFVKQLNGTILSSSSAIYKGTVSGEYAVGVSYEDPLVSLLVSGADNIYVVYPEEGAVWLPAGAAIIKGAKNMDNAKLFMDWLISDEGQKEIAKTTARPVNPDITNTAKEFLPFSQIKVAYEDYDLCANNKDAWCARWNEIVAKSN